MNFDGTAVSRHEVGCDFLLGAMDRHGLQVSLMSCFGCRELAQEDELPGFCADVRLVCAAEAVEGDALRERLRRRRVLGLRQEPGRGRGGLRGGRAHHLEELRGGRGVAGGLGPAHRDLHAVHGERVVPDRRSLEPLHFADRLDPLPISGLEVKLCIAVVILECVCNPLDKQPVGNHLPDAVRMRYLYLVLLALNPEPELPNGVELQVGGLKLWGDEIATVGLAPQFTQRFVSGLPPVHFVLLDAEPVHVQRPLRTLTLELQQ
mmetsp:Transcript_85556/g.242642  ORF Transcript_85556/g.242642 Transcript_85556/m.242642 type:complete len:263 (+) Transcript_85556:240-1028(+)